jgi:feruloyl esterase
MVLHGGSDPVFSIADTLDWYRAMLARGGRAARAGTRFSPCRA